MKKRIEEYNKSKQSLKNIANVLETEIGNPLREELKVWVTNKSIPLNVRWRCFFDSGLGHNYGWNPEFKAYDIMKDFDPYWADVGEEVCLDCHISDALVSELEYEEWAKENNKKPNSTADFTRDTIIELQEEILNRFMKSFTFEGV